MNSLDGQDTFSRGETNQLSFLVIPEHFFKVQREQPPDRAKGQGRDCPNATAAVTRGLQCPVQAAQGVPGTDRPPPGVVRPRDRLQHATAL